MGTAITKDVNPTVKHHTVLEQATLWIIVGLFVVLGVSWVVCERVYLHYHPTPAWPGEGYVFALPSNAQLSFLLGTLLAVLGFFQLGFQRWFQRETFSFLFWAFLLFGLCLALDCWTFALATRFWTLTWKMQSDQARRGYEMSRQVAPYFLMSMATVGVLNMGLALLRKRSS